MGALQDRTGNGGSALRAALVPLVLVAAGLCLGVLSFGPRPRAKASAAASLPSDLPPSLDAALREHAASSSTREQLSRSRLVRLERDQPEPQAATRPSLLRGCIQVVEARTGLPLAGASVELCYAAANAEEESVTLLQSDQRGMISYEFEPGDLRIVAWKDNLTAGPEFLDLDFGASLAHTLGLLPSHLVQGRVVDGESGLPVVGATIGFLTFSERDQVLSGADGWFEHPRFPHSGSAEQVHISAPLYGTSVRYLTISASGAWELPACDAAHDTLQGGRDSWMEFALVPERSVSGTLVDAAGQPIEGAQVLCEGFFRVLPDVASRDMRVGRSDVDGAFFLQGLRSDISHGMLVSAPGFEELCIELDAGARRSLALGNLTLVRETIVAGMVVDADGMPAEDIHVELVRLGESGEEGLSEQDRSIERDVKVRLAGHWREARTDAFGAFVFERTQPAAYRLLVSRGENLLLERALSREELLGAAYLELRLPAAFSTLVGQVLDAPEGSRVELRRHGLLASVQLDNRGFFRLAGLDAESPYDLVLRGEALDDTGELLPWMGRGRAWAHELPVLQMRPLPSAPKLVLAKNASK